MLSTTGTPAELRLDHQQRPDAAGRRDAAPEQPEDNDADLTARYWRHANLSDWQPSSAWEHRRVDGSGAVDVVGQVIMTEPPTRLVITFDDAPDYRAATRAVGRHVPGRAAPGHLRLTVTHENLANQEMLGGISRGWPAVLANLKSLLETDDVLPQAPGRLSSAHS